MISSKEISQIPLSNEIFYQLLQIKTLVRVMSMVSVEATILAPIALIKISLHFFRPLHGRIILDLHKNLFKACSKAYTTNSVPMSLPSCYFSLSSLPSFPSLDEDLAQNDAGDQFPFSQLSSFSYL